MFETLKGKLALLLICLIILIYQDRLFCEYVICIMVSTYSYSTITYILPTSIEIKALSAHIKLKNMTSA